MKIVFFLIIICLKLTSANEIINLTTGEWPPYTSKNNLNERIAQKIVSEAFKLVGVDTKITYYPWKRAYKMAKELDVDATFPWERNEGREADFYFSKKAILSTRTVFFHLKSFNFQWENFEDLAKYKIGATEGYNTATVLKDNGLKMQMVFREVLNFKKLLRGRIDITPSSYFVGYNIINKNFSIEETSKFTNHTKLIYPEKGVFFLISKRHPYAKQLMEKFDRGLELLIQNGFYEKILENGVTINYK